MCVCVYLYVCIYIYIYMYVYIDVYIHTHPQCAFWPLDAAKCYTLGLQYVSVVLNLQLRFKMMHFSSEITNWCTNLPTQNLTLYIDNMKKTRRWKKILNLNGLSIDIFCLNQLISFRILHFSFFLWLSLYMNLALMRMLTMPNVISILSLLWPTFLALYLIISAQLWTELREDAQNESLDRSFIYST